MFRYMFKKINKNTFIVKNLLKFFFFYSGRKLSKCNFDNT